MVTNTCRSCGHDSPAQSKFCGECGAAFQVACRFCEHSNPAGSQFCNQCGGQMNLLPCPSCGAVIPVTAVSCYQCHSDLSGVRSVAFELAPSPNDPRDPCFAQDSDTADDEAAFAEIKRFYEQAPPRGMDDSGQPSRNGNFGPLSLQPPEMTGEAAGFSDITQADDRLLPHGETDGVRSAPASGVDSVAPYRVPRALVATAILVVIAAAGYYEYHERTPGNAGTPLGTSSQSGDREGPAAVSDISRNVADLKTLPASNVQAATIGDRARPGPDETATASASLVSETREPAIAAAPEPEGAAAVPTEHPVAGKAAMKSASLVPGFPEFAFAPALEVPGAILVGKGTPVPGEASPASAHPAPEKPEPAATPERKPTRKGTAKQAQLAAGEQAQRAPAKTAAALAYPVQGTPDVASARLESPEEEVQGRPGMCRGSYYTAIWTNCVGEVTFSDGNHYSGEFRDGLYHGHGTATLPDGETYVGELRNGRRDGQGAATYPDGRTYVGEWKDDKAHGQGTATYPDGRKYVGEFKKGKRDGRGTAIYPDGRKYVGEWRNDTYDGQGTAEYRDGFRYVGEFRNGVYHGQGTAIYPGGFKYVGGFRDGHYHGKGTATSPDSSVYVGEFRDGHYDGQGTVTYPDGFRYVGEWKNDKAHGKGTAFFPDGRKYVGEWKDDKPNGRGTEYRYDGLILRSGIWADGKFVKG